MQATVDRPRFRQDLVAEPIEDGGARFIDVMDPDSGTLFRFFEVEYSLACAMDGQRDVAGIVKWAEEELGLKPSQREVATVINTLGELGYLERGAAAAAAASAAAAAQPAAAKPSKTPTPAAGIKKAPEQPALNRWDQPTTMGDTDEYLERGVVHGGGRANTPAPDVELGKAGTRPAGAGDLPRAPELELGAPGVTATAAAARGAGKAEDIALGAPGKTGGASNVEVDLAADMPLSPAAVKEAVRQSQVMKAVDVPPELADEMKPAAKAETKPAAKAEAKPVEAKKGAAPGEAKPVEKKPAEKPVEAKKPAEKPVEAKKPVEKRPVEKAEPLPPAPARGVSPVLIAALVLAILAAGGFALWKFVLNKKPTETSQAKPTPPPPQPTPPAPPPVETAKLATDQPAATEVKPSAPGQVATMVANDTAVKEGDPIARLVGFKPIETQVKTMETAVTKAKDAIAAAEKERDAAQTAGNKAGVTAAEKKLATAQKTVTDQEAKLATQKANLDKYLIKAPTAGKVTAVAKANAKVTPTDVVATVTPDPILAATFKSAGEVAPGTRVLLALKGSDQKLSCKVLAAGGDGVKIGCPKDAAADGAEVSYAGVDPNAPPETPADQGSAATPPAGSAATPADQGSAAAPADKGAGDKGAGDKDAGDKAPAEKPAEKKAAPPRPRPRPRPPAEKPADKGSGGSAGSSATPPADKGSAPANDKPADKGAAPGVDPTPPPAGSGGLQ
jgi:hypothetical protein